MKFAHMYKQYKLFSLTGYLPLTCFLHKSTSSLIYFRLQTDLFVSSETMLFSHNIASYSQKLDSLVFTDILRNSKDIWCPIYSYIQVLNLLVSSYW